MPAMLLRPVALFLLAYRIWRRVPPSQRRRLRATAQLALGRLAWRYGPGVAGAVLRRSRTSRP